MLFKKEHLEGIKKGTIHLAFRKWEKLRIRKGTILKTAIGLVKVLDITKVEESSISNEDLKNSGFQSRLELLNSFYKNAKGDIYKINIIYHTIDPRIKLREQTELTEQETSEILSRLKRLDKFSRHGKWTKQILFTIRDNPNFHAQGISDITGFEKEWLKRNIRKLKDMGLTISHMVGYELSPLGSVIVDRL